MSDVIIADPFTVGEIPDPIEYQFLDADGNPLSLSGYTAKFSTKEESSSTPAVDLAAATISDAANGKVTYTWTGAEFTDPGSYVAEIWVGNLTQRYASVRILYTVRSGIGSVPVI